MMSAMLIDNPILVLAQEKPISPLAGMLFSVGIMLILLGVWSSLRKKLRNPDRYPPPPAERIERLKQRHGAKASIESLMVDAEELTRRLAAHLDNKAERIEILLNESKQVLARLESATENAAGGHPSAPRVLEDPTTRSIYDLADKGCSPIEIAESLEEQVGKVELVLALRTA